VPVSYSGETISDARLADVDGDRRPDLAVGRWPVRNVDDLSELVQRTLANEDEVPSQRAVFVADGTESRFMDLNESMISDSGLAKDDSLLLNGPTSVQIGEAWGQGAWLMTYAGHGSLDRWGKEGIFSTEAVTSLESSFATPIVLQLTCLTGLFAHPSVESLSETMLHHENGPVAIIAPTSLSLSDDQKPFGVAIIEALQDRRVRRVGDALLQAKAELDIDSSVALREISDTFGLLGDPSAPVLRTSAE